VVETWQTLTGDLLLVGSRTKPRHDLERLRSRLGLEPYRTALKDAWRTDRLEGVLARFVAGPGLAVKLQAGTPVDTDDRNRLEFGFARSLGASGLLDAGAVRAAALEAGASLPEVEGGDYDPLRVLDERLSLFSGLGEAPPRPQHGVEGLLRRADAHLLWTRRSRRAALEAWRGQEAEPLGPNELALVAEVTADAGEERATGYIEALRAYQPAEADACLGRLRLRQGRMEESLAALESAFTRYRTDPWPAAHSMQGALDAALELAGQKPELAQRLVAALREPFALRLLDEIRMEEAFLLGSTGEPGPDCVRLLEPVEPEVPWTAAWLNYRMRCYAKTGDDRVVGAVKDVDRFEAFTREPLLPPKVD